MQALQQWPYTAGTAFIQARYSDGGTAAVNEALRHLPVSTEQILHPERYPNDTPQPLDVPDLSADLGPGWHDLDVMEVGEAWLQMALALRIDGPVAAARDAGLGRRHLPGLDRRTADGGACCAPSGTRPATPGSSPRRCGSGPRPRASHAEVLPRGEDGVDVAFATDPATLEALAAAVD